MPTEGAASTVSLEAVTCVYPGPVEALRTVDFEVRSGSLVGLVGANGSGKSTLLRVLAGVHRPKDGEVRVLGESLSNRRAVPPAAWRREVSFVAQEVELDPEMTGSETLHLIGVLSGVPPGERPAAVARVVEDFELDGVLARMVKSYSGGQKRRLHIAVGMIGESSLLLLDEPTAGLDEAASARLWRDLRARADRGATVVVASHDLAAVATFADAVAFFSSGRILGFGRPDSFSKSGDPPDLASIYRELTGLAIGELGEHREREKGGGRGGGGRRREGRRG